MATIGVGSIVATFALGWLKRRLGPNGQAALGVIGTVVSLFLLAAAREPILALVASFISGASSIVALTTFFVSAQVALPEWVRGRGLAIFLTAYFGALTFGSALWGEVATVKGVPFALTAAGVGDADRSRAHMGLEAAGKRGQRSHALDALARAVFRQPGRGR